MLNAEIKHKALNKVKLRRKKKLTVDCFYYE